MKKRFFFPVLTVLISAMLCAFLLTLNAFAASADSDIADTGAGADLSTTGAAYEDLGASFYARISLEEPQKYLTIPDDPMKTTQLKEYADSSIQFWHFTRQSDGSYKIRNVNKNLYLELYNGTYIREFNETIHATANNLPDQRWFLKKAGNGYQLITSCNTSFMLRGVNLYSSAEVIISQDSANVSTHFVITKLPISSDLLATPSFTLSCATNGVSITWDKVYYASSYRVYRYNTSTKSWASIAKTSGTSYVDKSVKSGTTYQYYVRCVSPMVSNYKIQSIKYLAMPSSIAVTNTVSGPVITWGKVAGAQAYRVFYKTTGSWKVLGNTTGTKMTHTKPSYNVNYTYTVRCVSADYKKFTSAYNTTGVKNRIVQTPKLTVTLKPNGYQLNWNTITGAYRYMVMVQSKATNWKWVKVSQCIYNNLFYSSAANNQAYYFTVRCMDEKNKYISGYTSSAKFTYYSAPRVSKLKITSTNISLSWNKVSGAAKYAVYSWNGKKWIQRTVTTGASATFKVSGTTKQNQCFAVRCLNKNSKTISSYFETILSNGKIVSYSPGGYSSKNKF